MRHSVSSSLPSPSALSLLLFLLFAGAAQAGVIDDAKDVFHKGRSTHQLDVDNDSMLLKRDDGLYTSGLRYNYQAALREKGRLVSFGWRLGQELYTSVDINLPPAQVRAPDHPYAAWLYTGLYRREQREDGSGNLIGLDFGCLGPCAAGEWTQNRLHQLINQPLPQAWSRQVRNEFGVVLNGEWTPARWSPATWLDVAPSVHGRFGNIFTDAGAGLLVRAGRLNRLADEPTLHAFLRLDERVVGYNATLQGGYFSKNNPHTVKPKRLVGDVEAGLQWQGRSFGAMLSVVRRSNEIADLPDSQGTQKFARVSVSYSY